VLNGSAPVGIPWPSLLAFLRILANLPRRGEALVDHGPLAASNDRLTVENVWIPTHHERHVQILASLLPLAATHLLAADAYLATSPSNTASRWIRPMATSRASLACAGQTRSPSPKRNRRCRARISAGSFAVLVLSASVAMFSTGSKFQRPYDPHHAANGGLLTLIPISFRCP
jgi:hypothetical protein